MENVAAHHFEHPYSMEIARWIRENLIMESDEEKRDEFLTYLEEVFGSRYAEMINYMGNDYRIYIRDDQMIPSYDDYSWNGAVFCCGRAFGKTWCGSPATIEFAMQNPNCRIGLLAPTFAMGRQNMIQGSSGILALSPKGFKPKYNKSEGSLTWPNGATAKIFSAENGDRVRGENFHYIWADEFCFFKFTGDDTDLWKMAKMALRSGKHPRYVITTSPKPVKEIIKLYEASQNPDSGIVFKRGTTFDNYALPQSFIDDVLLGEGTSLYNQEVLGMILEENLDAIFRNEDIKRKELDTYGEDPEKYTQRLYSLLRSMDKIVVAVDPNVVDDANSDETGVVICGRKGSLGYVFEDASRRGRISEIYQMIVNLYHKYDAECIVVETNNGGDFIPNALYNIDNMVVVKKVFASRGKRSRAEPIGLLYERGLIYHVGVFQDLESQMTNYNPVMHKKSPDRMDALVWAFTHLYPSTKKGLYGGDTPESFELYKEEMEKKGKVVVSDLHHEVYNMTASNTYALATHESDNDDTGCDVYSLI